jgi:hypothetical protein
VATISSLVDRVRVELGDLGKSFVTQFVADGTTNRFKLHYSPLDATTVRVYASGTEVTSVSYVEESTGVLVVSMTHDAYPSFVDEGTDVPKDGVEFTVSGTYYRYFTGAELTSLITSAVEQHTAKHTDSLGRKITVDNLPLIDEYPVAVYATTLALYTLATDAAFDIDIAAPDGVSIPRSERYRQLMEMIQTRQAQYRDLCVQLGVGLYSIDVFTLRRISKTTNRYVPVYKPQEVDDRSFPQRAHLALPTYGDQPQAFPTENGEFTAYQGRSYSKTVTLTANYAGKSFVAKLVQQRGSVQVVQNFGLSVASSLSNYTITAASRTSGSHNIILTTSETHNLTAGTSVVITDVSTAINGTYTVAAPITSNSFAVVGTPTTALSLTNLSGTVDVNATQTYTFTLGLTSDQTLALPNRTWWEIETIDSITAETLVIDEGNFFTVRASEVIL